MFAGNRCRSAPPLVENVNPERLPLVEMPILRADKQVERRSTGAANAEARLGGGEVRNGYACHPIANARRSFCQMTERHLRIGGPCGQDRRVLRNPAAGAARGQRVVVAAHAAEAGRCASEVEREPGTVEGCKRPHAPRREWSDLYGGQLERPAEC